MKTIKAMKFQADRRIRLEPRSMKTWLLLTGTAICFGFLFLFLNSEETGTLDFFFHLRGPRHIPSRYLFITLSDADIDVLGGWPVTRDYYGYMIHILHTGGAKGIGFDILFDHENHHYPEYDRALASFIESSQSTVLPCVLHSETASLSRQIEKAEAITCPATCFSHGCARIGFSNLGAETRTRHVPAVMQAGDSVIFSFGLALAAQQLGCQMEYDEPSGTIHLTKEGRIVRCVPLRPDGHVWLNHFGSLEQINHISFVKLMKIYESNPDSLTFEGKAILIAATATSLPVIKQTPFSQAMPASLIHLTLAENIIENLVFVPMNGYFELLLNVIFFTTLLASSLLMPLRLNWVASAAVVLLYIIFCFLCFLFCHLIQPCFLTVLGGMAIYLVCLGCRIATRTRKSRAEQVLLEHEINKTVEALSEAEDKLVELQNQLKREDSEKTQLSEQTMQLARDKRAAVEALEKHLRDLEASQNADTYDAIHKHDEIVFSKNSKMADVLKSVQQVAADDIPVLLTGETGTGKELIARAIHRESYRKNAPFVAVNCGALPETLLESELFGHEKGSFTGATARRRGRFELANGGTLFLDEITETTQTFQARLLRALQEKIIERLGSEQSIPIDVRIVAASNQDIRKRVDDGTFRSDLFFRINGFRVELPPLRERREDVPVLAAHFIDNHGYKGIGISESAMSALVAYPWPGNIRELENAIRRGALLATNEKRPLIQLKDLPDDIQQPEPETYGISTYKPVEQQILELMRQFGFSRSSISQTAKILGNRDRGTITEYLRGVCFETYILHHFDLEQTVVEIACTDEKDVKNRVRSKIEGYLSNLQVPDNPEEIDLEQSQTLPAAFKGLPKKYHPQLKQILIHLSQQ